MSAETETTENRASEQSATTQRLLILAAMRLMAAEGIDGVSLRAVNVAAGARNASAAHYHFGNKLGLIEAIVETLEKDVAAVRTPLVAALRDRAAKPSPREIIEAAYLPFMGLLFHPDYSLPGIRFLSRLIVDTTPELRVLANKFTSPLAHEVLEMLHDALPELPLKVLKMRILFSLVNLINGMSDVLALETSPFGDMSTPGSLEAADHFIEYIACGITAPPSSLNQDFVALSRGIIHTYEQSGQGEGGSERAS